MKKKIKTQVKVRNYVVAQMIQSKKATCFHADRTKFNRQSDKQSIRKMVD